VASLEAPMGLILMHGDKERPRGRMRQRSSDLLSVRRKKTVVGMHSAVQPMPSRMTRNNLNRLLAHESNHWLGLSSRTGHRRATMSTVFTINWKNTNTIKMYRLSQTYRHSALDHTAHKKSRVSICLLTYLRTPCWCPRVRASCGMAQ
jgi:predicted Zn-dependent protease